MSMCVSSSIGKVKMLNNISWMVGDYFEVFSFTLKIKSLFFWDCVRLVGFNWNEFILNKYGLCVFIRALSSSTGG